ncbi:uncharacterized protein At3g43530-like [Capsella rubella]|uniref:uncharacterized protein At3g43530-like n=1 Tax=Capsella rubella TaxID=81985 RepID=UPI000CD52E67|nr:uncharacterized protein At3g43530-like [Capsella rubella]
MARVKDGRRVYESTSTEAKTKTDATSETDVGEETEAEKEKSLSSCEEAGQDLDDNADGEEDGEEDSEDGEDGEDGEEDGEDGEEDGEDGEEDGEDGEEDIEESGEEEVEESGEEEDEEDEESGAKEDEESGEGSDKDEDEASDEDDDSHALPPEKMYFGPSEYMKSCKIGTRCSVTQTVEYIETFETEVSWFRKHPQFKHIFHMPKEPNHMTQGMWMLLLRTACTEMVREAWFVVNGVPIRYSLREHALLTGLHCHEYPKNWKKLGDLKFVKRIFKRDGKIRIKDVEEKLKGMRKGNIDTKKLIVLYFLCKVLKADSKGDGYIEEFLLSVVDDLNACERFPWGRYSFE